MRLYDGFIAFLFFMAIPLVATAGPLQAVTLAPISHTQAEIEIVGLDGATTTYSPAELEAFPTYALHTTTPWRSEAAAFEGVLLRDVLAANGLADAPAILVTAENEFSTTIPRAVWENTQLIIATRVDGRPHSRRARGPLQFVIDMDEYQAADVVSEQHLVWMAARITAAE